MTLPDWVGVAGVRVTDLLPGPDDLQAAGRNRRQNLLAGLSVAVVALPLVLAFGLASGLGASAVLATAVVAGAVAVIFGGSNLQVSGPTGAMTVVLIPIVHRFGPSASLSPLLSSCRPAPTGVRLSRIHRSIAEAQSDASTVYTVLLHATVATWIL